MADSSSSFYNPELVAEQAVMMNMIQKCSVSEIEKVEDSDLLSDLPLGIIHIILALIPIKEAVRTSVLSTQWRYTWTTLPHLEFDDRCASPENKAEYEKFITRVLFRHKGPIHKFSMSCPCDFEDIDEIIFCLSRNDVRELYLGDYYVYDNVVKMHSSIYSCKKMTNLRLSGCELDPPPLNFKGFLFLRFLSLGMVSFSPDEVSSLVAVCPLLEIFELVGPEEYFELKISAPYLKYMDLVGEHEKICINAPLLTEISVQLDNYRGGRGPTDEELKSSVDYAKCFGGFSNLQKLFGSGAFIEYLSLGIELCHHSLVFHHLKVIHLEEVNSKDAKQMMVVAHLVIGAPSLQELFIGVIYTCVQADDSSRNDDGSDFFKDLGCASNYKLERLSVVSLYFANGLTLEVGLLKFLIESSPALERMSVGFLHGGTGTEEKWNNLRAKLEGCNWASPTVQLRNARAREQLLCTKHEQAFRCVFGR